MDAGAAPGKGGGHPGVGVKIDFWMAVLGGRRVGDAMSGWFPSRARDVTLRPGLPDRAGWGAPSADRAGGLPPDRLGQAGRVAGRRVACLTVSLLLAAVAPACSSTNAADEFCNSYGSALKGMLAAAKSGDQAAFKSTMDGMPPLRAKAPDDKLRSAFDRSMFVFSVFSSGTDLTSFLSRVNLSDDAVVTTCGEYGVEVHA